MSARRSRLSARPGLGWGSLVWAGLCLLLLGSAAQANAQRPLVVNLTLDDTVQPISAGYLVRGLAEASSRHAALVVVSLNTPGGLLDSTREMVHSIEGSPVPVAIYVAPSGARAGSAGFFLLESADIAAMAPATNAGASHPIVEGANSAGMDPILKQKIENDAAAFLRSFTAPRGRDVVAAEDAVRNSKSYTAAECLKLHLIDRIAGSEGDLLRDLDGTQVKRLDDRTETLTLTNATVEDLPPSDRERFLTRLTDPDLAILLLLGGILLIYVEFNVPGTIIPGSLGTLLVLLGLFGLNLLPIRHTAVALLFAGLLLMVLELKVASHGILALAGSVALVVGLATLVDAPAGELHVHLATAIAAGLSFSAISALLASLALRARRNKKLLGPDALVGRQGITMTVLAPGGQVEVRGELWRAQLAAGGELRKGAPVLVRELRGFELLVVPDPAVPNPAVPALSDVETTVSAPDTRGPGRTTFP